MKQLYEDTFDWMEGRLAELVNSVPTPKLIQIGPEKLIAFRFTEKSIEQAIVQKLARMIQSLRSSHFLLMAGFLQDQAALCRILAEVQEDITFLYFASTNEDPSAKIICQYLTAFYVEEFEDNQNLIDSNSTRNLVPRKKVRAFIANKGFPDPSTNISTSQTISTVFSGYVHAASPQIMEMFNPSTMQFDTNINPQSELFGDHIQDYWNWVYRGLLSFTFAAVTIADNSVLEETKKYLAHFIESSGTSANI